MALSVKDRKLPWNILKNRLIIFKYGVKKFTCKKFSEKTNYATKNTSSKNTNLANNYCYKNK